MDLRKSEKEDKTLNAKLFVRILPTTDFNYDLIQIESNKKVLYVRCLQDLAKSPAPKVPKYWSFYTDGIFWNSCQSEVYEMVTANLYEELFDGVRALFICYGQTGSGKTFTTSGLRCHFKDRGLILRILSQLFEEREQRQEFTNISLGISYLEFVGETVKDLISNKVVKNVCDAREYPVVSESWAWAQIFDGECRKSFSESAPYKNSNRGHSILTLHVHAESLVDTDPVIRHSKVHVVDMGGIDYLGNKPSAWRNKSDLGSSNLSKSLMEQFLLSINGTSTCKFSSRKGSYKSSRLLTYLHDTLHPTCLIRFVAHIHGDESNLPLTLSALKFGELIRAAKPTKLERVYQSNCFLRIRNLEREFMRMKEETELIGMLADSPDYSNLSQERLRQIKRAAERFLVGQLENLTLFSLGQATLTLEIFRNMYQRLAAEKDQLVKDAIATATEMLQAQLANERNSTSSFPVLPVAQKLSRRKSSRQQDSQISFGASFRSSESGPNGTGKIPSSVVQQAGVTDRRGISIGPGKTSATYHEGNITKAFKKLKSKKSDSLISKGVRSVTTKDFGVGSLKNRGAEDMSELLLPQGIPSRSAAWQNFFNENTDWANELRGNVETYEEKVLAARRNYTEALSELARLREEVDEYKQELENCQHVRHVHGKWESDEDGRFVPGELEKNFMEVINQKEQQVNVAVEYCHVALVDFRDFAEQLKEAKRLLEETFQVNKCEDWQDEDNESEVKSEELAEEILSESELRNQARMELYARLQEKLLNYIPRQGKKEWQNLF